MAIGSLLGWPLCPFNMPHLLKLFIVCLFVCFWALLFFLEIPDAPDSFCIILALAFELYDFKEDFKQYSKLGEGAYGTGVEALGEITGAVENTGKAVKLEARICDVG